jgi:predicted permease
MSLPAADTARVLSNTALYVFVPCVVVSHDSAHRLRGDRAMSVAFGNSGQLGTPMAATTAAIVASSRLSVSCDTLRLASRAAVRKVMK